MIGSSYGLFVSVLDFVRLKCSFHLLAYFEQILRRCCRCLGVLATSMMSSAKNTLFMYEVLILALLSLCLFSSVIRSFMKKLNNMWLDNAPC